MVRNLVDRGDAVVVRVQVQIRRRRVGAEQQLDPVRDAVVVAVHELGVGAQHQLLAVPQPVAVQVLCVVARDITFCSPPSTLAARRDQVLLN